MLRDKLKKNVARITVPLGFSIFFVAAVIDLLLGSGIRCQSTWIRTSSPMRECLARNSVQPNSHGKYRFPPERQYESVERMIPENILKIIRELKITTTAKAAATPLKGLMSKTIAVHVRYNS